MIPKYGPYAQIQEQVHIPVKAGTKQQIVRQLSYAFIWIVVLPFMRWGRWTIVQLHEYADLTIGIYSTLEFGPCTACSDHVTTMLAA